MGRRKKPRDVFAESLALHEKFHGKIEVHSKVPLTTRRELSLAYTPGVGAVCKAIDKDKNLAYRYTLKANTIAIVTDGSRVLSLGNIGGYAAIPVMEGKALLFRNSPTSMRSRSALRITIPSLPTRSKILRRSLAGSRSRISRRRSASSWRRPCRGSASR